MRMSAKLTKREYEDHVVRALHRYLIERDPGISYDGKISVDAIRLDPSDPQHMVELLFRDGARPWCIFGWRFPATEADESPHTGVSRPTPWETGLRGPEQAEIWASTFVLTNFVEEVEAVGFGLPPECEADSVTWVGDYKP